MKFIQVKKNSAKYTITKQGKHVFFLNNYSGALKIDILSEGAEVYICGIYIGRGTDAFNVKTIQKHSAKKTISDLYIKGVFFDTSKFLYEGLIRIEKGANQSNAYQKNQNIILSPDAYVDSRPFLEINAHDVRCTHGSTTGRLNRDDILYVQNRGLNSKQAQALLIEGFVNDVFNRLSEIGYEEADKLRKSIIASL